MRGGKNTKRWAAIPSAIAARVAESFHCTPITTTTARTRTHREHIHTRAGNNYHSHEHQTPNLNSSLHNPATQPRNHCSRSTAAAAESVRQLLTTRHSFKFNSPCIHLSVVASGAGVGTHVLYR
jgi:hypothetical protein